jgi:hypothetical protein
MTARLRALYCTLAALAVCAAAAPAAQAVQDPIPVGPNYYFTATVNGGPTPTSTAVPVIKVVCPGPIYPGETGHPISGQTVEVDAVFPPYPNSSGLGFTGSAAKQIDAIFSSPAAASTNPPIVLSDFFVAYPIPTTLNLPCGGSGVVSFVPIPTSQTARGVAVNVYFQNIAV